MEALKSAYANSEGDSSNIEIDNEENSLGIAPSSESNNQSTTDLPAITSSESNNQSTTDSTAIAPQSLSECKLMDVAANEIRTAGESREENDEPFKLINQSIAVVASQPLPEDIVMHLTVNEIRTAEKEEELSSDSEEENDEPIKRINQSTAAAAAEALPDDLMTAIEDVTIASGKSPESDESSSDSGEESDTASIRTTTRSVISQADRRPPSPYDGFQRLPLETSAITEGDFTLPQVVKLLKIGAIRTILDNIIVVESLPGTPPLDLHSVLFLNQTTPLGRIFDVFGPVIRPLYSLRFESEEDFDKISGLVVGADVSVVPSDPHLTAYIFVKDLQKLKGTDASWEDDGELPDEMEEFSDDEQEKLAKQQQQRTKRPLQSGRSGPSHPPKPVMALPRPLAPARPQWRPPMVNSRLPQQHQPMQMPQNLFGGMRSPFHMPPPRQYSPRHQFNPRLAHPFSSLPTPNPTPPPKTTTPDTSLNFVPSLPRPEGLTASTLVNFPSASSSTSAPLVTDPKTLPSAQVLFYNPKHDASLNAPKPGNNPWSFLR
ncbi:putative H/ACA ribonucleoprotein complex non-core subunit NAF1 [Hypsibius exemplaris]|uniref:H/ACA ribonucleoprotein complex non-core subunit NAF1 n=1 Tax=Hypsibius exemplaris TaxID=2072580 RepID=A0A1W0WN49_HYPEX|nr:putative H/ACA ribonucleoprotein complex non-core subunit NAF1 [Hypsibius exemplaris]